MKRFHHAVRRWRWAREFAANATVAGTTGLEAAVRALLRVAAAQPRIDAALRATADDQAAASPDLVTAVLDWLCVQGPADPAAGLAAGEARRGLDHVRGWSGADAPRSSAAAWPASVPGAAAGRAERVRRPPQQAVPGARRLLASGACRTRANGRSCSAPDDRKWAGHYGVGTG